MHFKISVPSLMCEGCVEVLRKAIFQKDAKATIEADLENKILIVTSDLSLDLVQVAIKEAGHTTNHALS